MLAIVGCTYVFASPVYCYGYCAQNISAFFSRSTMCYPTSGAPVCSFPTRPCTSFLAWKTDDDRNWLDFWAHMADIPQKVSIHLGIWWWVTLTDTPLLTLLLFQATVLGLTHSSTAYYIPVFQPCDPVWCPESGNFPDSCILLVLLLMKADCWSACIYRLVLPKTCASDNPPPNVPPDHSCLVTQLVQLPRPVCVAP